MARLLFFALIWVSSWSSAQVTIPAETLAGRVLFLGDSITFSGDHLFNLQLLLKARHPKLGSEFLNLGLPSETVSGLSEKGHADGRFPRPHLAERLDRVLEATKPDLIIAAYGINCAIYQPFSEERFAAYQKGFQDLQARSKKESVPIIFLTPWPYDAQKGPEAIPADYDQVLARYRDWLLAQRANHWSVIDVHQPLKKELAELRKSQSEAAFTRDGIHFNSAGSWQATRVLASAFDLTGPSFPANEDAFVQKLIQKGVLASKADHQAQKNAFFTKRDEWLRRTGHLRPRTPGGPDDPKATR